ncbi:hypothetical protein EVAR_13984_1 [Eumeta japonica]|uniref:Uncharacterized protein n=1 Tax=Eumeta variegata TaxID=151549 RepID=A0A4C1U8G4_EUMVA|nr:hypothetical protein EVAR_13984_1 [Eumeta japonica]
MKRKRRLPPPPVVRCLVIFLQMTCHGCKFHRKVWTSTRQSHAVDSVTAGRNVELGAEGAVIYFSSSVVNLLENGSVSSVVALHHSWTSATSGLRGLFLITCRQNFFVCEAPSGARPSAVADVADAADA